MPQDIGGQTFPTPAEVDAKISAAKLPPDVAQATRLDYQQRVFAARRADAQAKYPGVAGSVGPAISTLANYGNTAAGTLPAAAVAAGTAALGASDFPNASFADRYQLNKQKIDLALGASPTAATVGKVGAMLAPTPINAAAKLGFAAAGGTALASQAAQEGSLAMTFAKQAASAILGGAGATVASDIPGDVVKVVSGEQSTGDTIRAEIGAAANPVNVAVGLGIAGLASLPRALATPAAVSLVQKAKNLIPNFKPTGDMYRDPSSFTSGVVDALSKTSAGRAAATSWLDENFYKPMSDSIASLKTAWGIGTSADAAAAREQGAGGVRSLLPVQGSIGSLGEKAIDIGRTRIATDPAMVDHARITALAGVIDAMDTKAANLLGSEGPNSAAFLRLKRNIRDVAQMGMPAPIGVLENWRQTLGDMANFEKLSGGQQSLLPNLKARDIREAKSLYGAVRDIMRGASAQTDQALEDIRAIRDQQRALSQIANVANLGDDKQLADAVFSAPNFQERWKTLSSVLPNDRLQALRGDYLGRFLEEVSLQRGFATDPKQALSLAAMRRLTGPNSTGPFRQEIFDRVLGPSVRQELFDRGMVSDMVLRSGVGRAEGSQTASRQDALRMVDSFTNLAASGSGVLGLPSRALYGVLGFAGRLGLANSIINGRLATFLNNMATGVPVNGNQIASAAIHQGGGVIPIATAGANLVGQGLGLAGRGLGALATQTNTGANQ